MSDRITTYGGLAAVVGSAYIDASPWTIAGGTLTLRLDLALLPCPSSPCFCRFLFCAHQLPFGFRGENDMLNVVAPVEPATTALS